MRKMNPPPKTPPSLSPIGPPPPAYQQLGRQLAETGWICQGTVVCRSLIRQVAGQPVKKGPYYLCTCKVKGRTVCIALSHAQYELLGQAIVQQRRVQKTLEKMQAMTLNTILRKVPGVKKRK